VQYADGKLAVERGAGRFIKREVTRVGAPHPGAGAVAAQVARAR